MDGDLTQPEVRLNEQSCLQRTVRRLTCKQVTAPCSPPLPPCPAHRRGLRETKTAFALLCVTLPLTLQQHFRLILSQVRVRPLLPREKLEQATSCVTSLSDKQIILGSDRAFTFDRACAARP